MATWTKYKKSTGEFVGHLKLDQMTPVERQDDFAYVEGYFDPNTKWMNNGAVEDRPAFNTMLSVGGGMVSVSGLPEGTIVKLNGVEIDSVDQTGNFDHPAVGRCSFSFELWPYQVKVIKTDA